MKIVYTGTHETFSIYMDGGRTQLSFKPSEPQEVADEHGTELLKRSDFAVATESSGSGEGEGGSGEEESADDSEKPGRRKR